ncbi:MAG: hypothetical protein NUV80_02920 [Candidatus Berkelbacteria bacterium]|nr:hypothetical protein [Candidatus Berkelbacteria bacterium]
MKSAKINGLNEMAAYVLHWAVIVGGGVFMLGVVYGFVWLAFL